MMHQTPDTMASAPDGLWLSLSELAEKKNVTKQTISERVKKLVDGGKLATRPGKGKSKLVNLAEYDRVVGESTDLSKVQGAQTKAAKDEPGAARDSTFAAEQARRAGYEAELKRLDLDERLGKIRQVDDIVQATVLCGETVVREIEALGEKADAIAAAVAKDGVNGAKSALKEIQFAMRKKIEEAFARLAAGDGPADPEGDTEQ